MSQAPSEASASAPVPAAKKPNNPPIRPLKLDEKAAIVLYSMGRERAEKFFQRMEEEDHRCFAAAFNRLKSVDEETVNRVLLEFSAKIGGSAGALRGGAEETRKFLAQFLDENAVSAIMSEMDGPAGRDVWEKLSNASPTALSNYLKHEQAQTIAVILSKLRQDTASKVFLALPPERAEEVLLRMAATGSIDRDVLNDIRDTLRQDFLSALSKQQAAKKPDDIIGAMFNQMPSDKALAFMGILEEKMPDMAERVQKVMFTFEDFKNKLDGPGIQAVIKACEVDRLVLALKLGKDQSPEVVEYFFANMSKRVGEQINDEMEALGPIRLKEAQAAQAEIIAVAQGLARKGEIQLIEGDEDGDDTVI